MHNATMQDYQPVNCEFHDVIESCATLRKPVAILRKNANGIHVAIQATIVDVFARQGVEYLQIQSGELIRLDHLLAVNGYQA